MINFDNIKAISKSEKKLNISFHDKNIIKFNENCVCKEIVLFSGEHGFTPGAKFYGDGYQKLQYGGTVAEPVLVGGYTDKDHYKMPQTDGYFTAYNYVTFEEGEKITLIGAASCNRFRTEFRINGEFSKSCNQPKIFHFPRETKSVLKIWLF